MSLSQKQQKQTWICGNSEYHPLNVKYIRMYVRASGRITRHRAVSQLTLRLSIVIFICFSSQVKQGALKTRVQLLWQSLQTI